MAIVMRMNWDGVTPDQYEQVKKVVNWEGNKPTGGMFHVTAFTGSGLQVADVWESAETFQSFVDGRLMPGVQQVGIAGEPQVEILPAHDVFAPAYRPV